MVDVAIVKMFGNPIGVFRWDSRYDIVQFEYNRDFIGRGVEPAGQWAKQKVKVIPLPYNPSFFILETIAPGLRWKCSASSSTVAPPPHMASNSASSLFVQGEYALGNSCLQA